MRITGKRFYFNLNEQLELLRESQESKSQSAAKKLLMQRLGGDEQQADEFVRNVLRNNLTALRKKTAAKFTLAATRMFIDQQLEDVQTIGELNTALSYAAERHYNEFDRNLNGLSAQDFINMMRPEIEADNKKRQNDINNTKYTQNNDYDIVRIDSFEQSQKYGNYTDWCITHMPDMWMNYTMDGINQFYFCLRKEFESVPKEKGENCPLDEYGLSMVAVSVNPSGNLNSCTCRWNHENGGTDNIMDESQISQLVGRNFYSTFKPSEKGAAQRRIILSIKKQFNLSDEDVKKIELEPLNNGAYIVHSYDGGYNFVTEDGQLLFPSQWLDLMTPEDNCGNYLISLDGKYNILNEDGHLLSPNLWFNEIRQENTFNDYDDYYGIYRGYYVVCVNGKWNIINLKGQLVSPNQWFDGIESNYGADFDTYKVLLNGKWNNINKEGKYQYEQWQTYEGPIPMHQDGNKGGRKKKKR